MALDGRSQLYKCILFVINIVLGLIGFTIMVLGMWVRFSSQTSGIFIVDLNMTSIVTVVTLLIVLGILMLVISAFGNYGACKESNGALIVFTMLFGFLLAFVIAAGTLAIVKSGEAGELLSDAYTTTYIKSGDPSKDIMLQFFHNMFDCCGIAGGIVGALVKNSCPKSGLFQSLDKPPCPVVIARKDYRGPFIGGLFGILALMILALICSIFLRKGISPSSDPSYNITVSTTVQQGISLGKTNR